MKVRSKQVKLSEINSPMTHNMLLQLACLELDLHVIEKNVVERIEKVVNKRRSRTAIFFFKAAQKS